MFAIERATQELKAMTQELRDRYDPRPMVKTSFYLPESLILSLEAKAMAQGRRKSAILRDLLEEGLNR